MLKNYRNTHYPHFSFIPDTGSIPQNEGFVFVVNGKQNWLQNVCLQVREVDFVNYERSTAAPKSKNKLQINKK